MKRKLRTARAFSLRDWLLLARAWFLLLWVDYVLRLQPFLYVRDWASAGVLGAVADETEVRRVLRMVNCAARHHLYPMRCLRRALVQQRLLRQCGVATELCFGVSRDGGDLDAHAWLEREGVPLGEPGDVTQRFAPLAAVEVAR